MDEPTGVWPFLPSFLEQGSMGHQSSAFSLHSWGWGGGEQVSLPEVGVVPPPPSDQGEASQVPASW